ncbi:MAG: hypothetical protein IT173_17705 [Acidobacteria bacterium]|nr:hypothetical protein [Acidobacteriota bacterium]
MREALFIFLIILLLAGFTLFRYRRHLFAMLELYRTVQGIRERRPRAQVPDEPVARGPLVNCQKCGTWVPEDKAVRLGRSAFYCSTKCLETSKAG